MCDLSNPWESRGFVCQKCSAAELESFRALVSGFTVALILWNVFMLCLLELVWSLMLADEF